MRALVTGGSGFLGRPLCARLAAQMQVETLQGEIRDPATFSSLAPSDIVYHLAAQSNVPASFADPAGTWAVNVEGTRNVLRWAQDAGVRRVVLMSTAHVYGRPVRSPLDEDHPTSPVSPYGATKLAAEAAGRMHCAQGLDVVIVRPFNIYGPGQAPGFLVADILNQVRQGKSLVLGDPAPIRDYTYLDDAIQFLVQAGTIPGLAGLALNLGSGQGHSVADVVAACQAASGSTLVPVHDPARFRSNEVPQMVANVTLAKRLLDWRPGVSLEEGLRRTWQSWHSHAGGAGP